MHGADALPAGLLAAVLAAGTKATFVPDLASQHIEQAKTVLVRGSWMDTWMNVWK
jgi:hypothetical protein